MGAKQTAGFWQEQPQLCANHLKAVFITQIVDCTAVTVFTLFAETYGIKYERAGKKLAKDKDALFTFQDFSAEHWKHKPD